MVATVVVSNEKGIVQLRVGSGGGGGAFCNAALVTGVPVELYTGIGGGLVTLS